jgi:thiamine-monophosphate kinase
VSELGERALIERIRARVPPAPPYVIVGIGDDAAVIEPERNAVEVVTTDGLVEGVHFDRAFVAPADIGHKALAVNLSDLAAMGAAPRVAVLSLMLPATFQVAYVDALLDGLLALAERAKIALVGGNISRSPGPLVIDVTAIGSVHRRRVLMRASGRAGDDLYVTGSIGGASAGLEMLQSRAEVAKHEGGRDGLADLSAEARIEREGGSDNCISRYLRPEPRTRFGLLLSRNRVTRACVDLSDGLADAVRQLAGASGTGATIEAEALPIDPAARRWFERRGMPAVDAALSGGEDYELLFAVSPKLRSRLHGIQRLAKGLAVKRIGQLSQERALVLKRDGRAEELPSGFTHFG